MKLVNTRNAMFRGWDVTTTVPSLSQIYGKEKVGTPNKIIRLFDKPVLQIFADAYSKVYGVNKGAAKGIPSMKYKYTVKGVPSYISRIVVSAAADTNLGRNFQKFTICVNENAFFNNDILYMQNEQQLKVHGNGIALSAGKWQYTVSLHGNNPDEVVDYNYLSLDRTISKIGNAQPEMSREGYMTQRNNEESRVNYLRKIRVGREWSGDAAMAQFAVCDTVDGKKNTPVMWMTDLEREMLDDLLFQKEMSLVWGKSNVDPETDRVYGANDFSEEAITGDGVYEAIKRDGINGTYTVFTESLLRDILGEIISRNPQKSIGEMNIVMMTGYEGMRQFDQAMRDALKPFFITSDVITTKKGDNVEIGAQFMTYKYMGAKFTVVRNPVFDDRQMLADELDSNGKPRRSSMFLILDMGTYDGVPNVQLFTKEGCNLITGYQLGFGGKNGRTSGEYSTPVQGARMDMMTYTGVAVHIPETCMVLRKSFI